ncbi:hypothetical protein L9F63_003212, partial [Diploptera punctata]
GQPEYTNDELEEELTEVRPLDLPLDLLQVEALADLNHVTTTVEVDSGAFTTASSRLNQQLREELEAAFKSDNDLGNWDQGLDMRNEELDHSGDGSIHIHTTTQQPSVDILKKDKQNIEENDDDDEDDDSDDESDEDDDDDDEDDGEDDDDDEDEDSENDSDDKNEDDDDATEDDTDDDGNLENEDSKTEQLNNEKRVIKQKTNETKTVVLNIKSGNFDESVEHGRQWKQFDSEEDTEEVTKATVYPVVRRPTNIPDISRNIQQKNLDTFLKNGSPEIEDHDNWNVSESQEQITNRTTDSMETKFVDDQKQEDIREIEKKTSVSQKLVDSVSARADEDLLELMVRIAQNPEKWHQVHHELQLLDQDLVSSRNSLKQLKSSNVKDKKNGEDIINEVETKTSVTKEHRKHLQGEKKKKKKKKQKQKGKLKNKVKGKEEIRREELEKAGVLSPPNVLYDSNVNTSKVSKESSKNYRHWNKSSKNFSHSKMKANPLFIIDPAKNTNNSNHKQITELNFETKGSENKYSSRIFSEKEEKERESSIDSALAQLTGFKTSLNEVSTNKLPSTSDTFKLRYNNHNTINNIRHSTGSNWLKVNNIENELDNSWPSIKDDQKNVKWYGDISRLSKDMKEAGRYTNSWDKSQAHPEKLKFRLLEENGLISNPKFNDPIEGSAATYTWQNSGPNLNPWIVVDDKNPKEERRYYNDETLYNSPNSAWPRFSVESLKHGSEKPWPDITLDRSASNKQDYSNQVKSSDWPNISLESETSKIKNWNTHNSPIFSDNNTKQNIISGKVNMWTKPGDDSSKNREIMTNTWSQTDQKHISEIDSAIAQHSKDASSNRQWPHFTYHRVTSSPQILAQQQKEAQQRNRQRNAYIAVSVITPTGKNKGFSKQQSVNSSSVYTKNKSNESAAKSSVTPLPDKIDQLLSMRSEVQKFPDRDLLEEQLVDMTVAGQQQQRPIPWSHARHLDKIQEQLKTLSAMGEKLQYHWLEKERLLQILRDGGKSASSFYRSHRNENTRSDTSTTLNNTNNNAPQYLHSS